MSTNSIMSTDSAPWFTVERLDADTYCLSEYRHPEETHSYLLIGGQRCLLIDTGLGVGDILAEVSRLTDKPVIAAATHVHWDHIGGHAAFPEFYVHEAEADWISGNFPLAERKVFQGTPAKILRDGDSIDLGGRVIEVIHTPGHSPGHMCFYEPARGHLFTGDLIYSGVLYANYPSTDPAAYLASLERLAGLPVQAVWPAHHALYIPVSILKDTLTAFRELDDRGLLCHGSGIFEYPGFSVRL